MTLPLPQCHRIRIPFGGRSGWAVAILGVSLLAPSATAWAETGLRLPVSEDPSAWRDALEMYGLEPVSAASGGDAQVELLAGGGGCVLVLAPDTEGSRSFPVACPQTGEDREDLAARAYVLAAPWDAPVLSTYTVPPIPADRPTDPEGATADPPIEPEQGGSALGSAGVAGAVDRGEPVTAGEAALTAAASEAARRSDAPEGTDGEDPESPDPESPEPDYSWKEPVEGRSRPWDRTGDPSGNPSGEGGEASESKETRGHQISLVQCSQICDLSFEDPCTPEEPCRTGDLCPGWWFRDRDRDGFGDGAFCRRFDRPPADGWVQNVGDCNDRAFLVHPGAEETPGNGWDEDCDGVVE